MEFYDELASSSSDEEDDYDEDDALYEPSLARKERLQTKAAVQKSSHDDKENKNPHFSDFLKDGEDGKKVTVEQCKDYLRKHGLRLSGTKAVLIERIKGHIQEQETSANAQLEGRNYLRRTIHDNLIEHFANMDLNKVNNVAITEDEKKLTIEDCKAYLRKHGLRLAGTKQVLVERIKEHLQIKDDQGLTKYPETTFTIDCQGDACIGDVVLFKQKVYELFNVGGRCSAGPPVGIRTIAGRIVKESYGSAKQQHTFTVEVLWSTGDRPLPPLHPLIIKGRNLYRVKTLRQAWADEMARTKQLQEKHTRGAAARKERMARIEGTKHVGFLRKQCRTADTFGGQSGKDSRNEKSAIQNPLLNGSKKVVPVSKTCSNIHAQMYEHVHKRRGAETEGSIHARKDARFCKTSNPIHNGNAEAHPLSQDKVCAQGDPSCWNRSAVYPNKKIDMVHMTTTCMMSSSTSIKASSKDMIPATTSSQMLSSHVAAVSSVEVRFSSSLAGLIIGKEGVHCKEVRRVSQAELSVEMDTANPFLCIVKITGTAHQKNVALKMVSQRILCKFFAKKGECRFGETCRYSHSLLSA